MKLFTYHKIIFAFIFLGFSIGSQAAPPETTTFDVDGLKVIHRSSVKDVISVRLFVKGGVNNYPADEAGIESLAFSLATSGGTTSLDKDAFAAALDRIGTSVSGSSDRDYGTLNLTCLAEYWDKSWDLFADAVMNPAMPDDQFSLLQQQMLANFQQSEADADSHIREMAYENAFKNTSYSTDPSGNDSSLASLSVAQVKKYYTNLLGKKRCFLVVVGKISDSDLKTKIASTLAKLPDGDAFETKETLFEPKPEIVKEQRKLTTNYILGLMSAPLVNSDETVPNQLAMSILYDRFFSELRTKRSLSYAPAAGYMNNIQHPFNVVYISTTDPKQSIEVMTAIIDSVKSFGFSKDELTFKKRTFMTRHYMGMETNEAISGSLGRYEIIGNWKMADEWPKKVDTTNLDDINSVVDQYCKSIYWLYLGNEDQVKDGDFKQL